MTHLQQSSKLKVFITVDTEVWECYESIYSNIKSGLWGFVDDREYGLRYQLAQFNQFDLKATFFLEPFFSLNSDGDDLSLAVTEIQGNKQEVALHVHTEWLRQSSLLDFVPSKVAPNIRNYSLTEQQKILSNGLRLLYESGAQPISCFRAGNYGANNETIQALDSIGISFDTSYNESYLGKACRMSKSDATSPFMLLNTKVTELPITQFYERRAKKRHLQLSACSFSEIKDVLQSNWEAGEYCCVLVMHSFEWINRNKKLGRHKLDKVCLNRFRLLCEFLSANRDKYETCHFKDINQFSFSQSEFTASVHTSRYIQRVFEQALRRLI